MLWAEEEQVGRALSLLLWLILLPESHSRRMVSFPA